MRRIFSNNAYYNKLPVMFVKGTSIDVEQVPDTKEKFKELLDLIYSANPNLGYPQGDLAIWLSDNANPEIKNFIQANLVRQTSDNSPLEMSTELQNHLRTAITDDDIASMYRRKGETRSEYSSRIYGYLQDMKLKADAKRQIRELKKIVDASQRESASTNPNDV